MPNTSPTPQPALLPIFEELKRLINKYSPPLIPREVKADKRQYHLWSVKDLAIAGRSRKEVYFAGVIVQKSYVGFYYMPVYAQPELKEIFPPEMLRLLKGKSCFHIKELSQPLKKQIAAALQAGFVLYQQRGWV